MYSLLRSFLHLDTRRVPRGRARYVWNWNRCAYFGYCALFLFVLVCYYRALYRAPPLELEIESEEAEAEAEAEAGSERKVVTLFYCSSWSSGYLKGTAASICAAAYTMDWSVVDQLQVFVAVPPDDYKKAVRYLREKNYPSTVRLKVVLFNPMQPDYRIRYPKGFDYLNSSSVWCRLHAPSLLPRSVEKFIYLDSDTLPVKDLTELWDVYDEYKAPLAAVQTCDVHLHSAGLKMMTLREEGYNLHDCTINNGVFAGNAETWRELGYTTRFHHLADRAREENLMPGLEDQHIMALFGIADGLQPLHPKWNVMVGSSIPSTGQRVEVFEQTLGAQVSEAAILHWTGPRKPWQPNAPFAHLWTPWNQVCKA